MGRFRKFWEYAVVVGISESIKKRRKLHRNLQEFERVREVLANFCLKNIILINN